MALPVDGQIVVGADAAPFTSPHNKPKLPLEDWSRGGLALNDASLGLDIYDWRGWCVEGTGEVWLEVEGEIAPTLVHTIPDPVSEFAFSFDTNMQPVLGWTTYEGVSWFRWFDPTEPGFVDILLPGGSYAVRVKHDDSRAEQVAQGATDTIVAYVRSSMVYYRLLRDRFGVEYTLLNSEGMSYLYQIGMNEGYRFMFSRSGEFDDAPRNLFLPRPPFRKGRAPLMFDELGNLVRHEGGELTGVQGKAGRNAYRTAEGATYHLQDHDGGWIESVGSGGLFRGEGAGFFQLPNSQAERLREWTRTPKGVLQLANDEQLTELRVSYREVVQGHGTTLTGMYRDQSGNGRTFDVVSITEGPAFGSFRPNYNATGDFANGLAPDEIVEYADYGPHVTLSVPAAHTGESGSTMLRWPVGTVPRALRPVAPRSVSCVVVKEGAHTAAALATIFPDGSASFTPLTSDTISDEPVVDYALFKVGSTSTDAMPAEGGAITPTTSRWRWTVPAGSDFALLLLGGGGRGGRGHVLGLLGGAIAAGGGGAGALAQFNNVPLVPGQPITINVGRGATDNGGGASYTQLGLPPDGKNIEGHALSRGGLSGLEGFGNQYYVSGGGNGGHANRFPANGEPGMAPSIPFPLNGDAFRAGGGGGAGNDPGDDQIGGRGQRNGGDSTNPGTDLSGGGGGGGMAAGSAGNGAANSGTDNEHGGDGGDGVALSALGWGDAVSEVGAPPTVAGGGGGAGYYRGSGSIVGDGGEGGSGVGGDGADSAGPTGAAGGHAVTDTGSGGGGASGTGTPGNGADGLVLLRWTSAGASFGLMVPGTFNTAGPKGLPASFTLTYPKDPAAPIMSDNFRITEEGDLRVTEDGDFRIQE